MLIYSAELIERMEGVALIREAALKEYTDIRIGDIFSFERTLSAKDVADFARLTGDYNPLHVDEDFAGATPFGGTLVHGMLSSSLFSTLVGMHCPGKNCLYLSQTLNFKTPIHPGDTVRVTGTVIRKTDALQTITLRTEITVKDKIAVSGEAHVKVASTAANRLTD